MPRGVFKAGLIVVLAAALGLGGALTGATSRASAAVTTTGTISAAALASSVAPTAPAPKTLPYAATLATTGQGLWGPGAAPAPVDIRQSWFSKSWDDSAGFNGVGSVTLNYCLYISSSCDYTSYFGGSLNVQTTGQLSLGDTVHGYQPGTVSVSYPMTTRFTAPADDSFAPGDTVNISTQVPAPTSNAAITTTSPTMTGLSIDGTFGMHASADGSLCFVKCTGGSIFSLDLPPGGPVTGSIMSLSGSDLTFVQGMGLGYCFGAAEKALFGSATFANDRDYCNGSGYIKLPNPRIGGAGGSTTTVSGTSLSATDTDQFIVVPVNAMTWLGRLVALPSGFPSMTAGFNGATVSYSLLDVALTAVISQTREVTYTPVVDVTMAFGRSTDYRVIDPNGNIVQNSAGAQATFPLGSTLRLVVPEAMSVTPTLTMAGSAFHNHTYDSLSGSARITALKVYGDLGGVSISAGPAYDSGSLSLGNSNLLTEADTTSQLGGFTAQTLAPFQLVPDPVPVPTARTLHPVEGAQFGTQELASFHDPDTRDAANQAAADYTASISWGDGHTSVGSIAGTDDSFTVSGTNTYAEEGSYAVGVTVTDIAVPTAHATAQSQAQVTDAPLTIVNEPALSSVEGSPTAPGTVVASFTDADPAAAVPDFSATIDWGDGHSDPALVAAGSDGRYDVLAPAHTYEEEGTPPMVVAIADIGGAQAAAQPSMKTADAPLTAGPPVTNGTLFQATTPVLLWPNPGNAVVATFTDADPHGAVSDFTAMVTWGDGTTSPGTVSRPTGTSSFQVTASHSYADGHLGQNTISVLIKDAGGSTETAGTTVLAYAFADGPGVFALGDKSVGAAHASTLLNFWGSRWDDTNAVSGASSPASFKGYVSNAPAHPTPPTTCPTAGSFTTGPGTSAKPPSTVPSYMAVLVTSQINKDGSVISSGQQAHWVIMRTEPGYAPSSGRDGYGTIVAGIC